MDKHQMMMLRSKTNIWIMLICRKCLILAFMLISILVPRLFAQETHTKNPNILSELTPAQMRIVESGGQVMTTTKVPGQPWPAVRVYQIVPALPEEITAVFFDYEAAPTYVPHVQETKISKKINARTHEIDYALSIPLLPSERYTIQNSLQVLASSTYEIEWKLLRATTTRASEGNFRVQPYGKNKSLICYFNFVVPGSNLAIVLRGIALEQVQKNVEALIHQVAKQKHQNPESLRHQIEALHQALEQAPPK